MFILISLVELKSSFYPIIFPGESDYLLDKKNNWVLLMIII